MIYQKLNDLFYTIARDTSMEDNARKLFMQTLKDTLDSAMQISIELSKLSSLYVEAQNQANHTMSKKDFEAYDEVVNQIQTEEVKRSISYLSDALETIEGYAEKYKIDLGTKNIDLNDELDMIEKSQELFKGMVENGQLMFYAKTKNISLEEAQKIVDERNEAREINQARQSTNYNQAEERAIRSHEKAEQKACEEMESFDRRMEHEINKIDLDR